jgi:sulfur-carrier protein
MPIQILYFASVREAMGRDGEVVDPPVAVVTLGDLADWFVARGDAVFENRDRLRGAIDQTMAKFDAPIAGAREIAFFPPVTGG